MNIQELLGEAYKEGMTEAEINEALSDKELVDKSTLPPSVPKDTFDKTARELSNAKKELAKNKSENLSESEKAKEAQRRAEEAEKEYLRKSTKLDVEKVFVSGGLTEEDYKDIIDGVVSEDNERSVTNARNIVALLQAQRKDAENAVKKDLQKSINKPTNGENGGMTLDKISEIKDATERQAAYAKYLKEGNN